MPFPKIKSTAVIATHMYTPTMLIPENKKSNINHYYVPLIPVPYYLRFQQKKTKSNEANEADPHSPLTS
jgi:hypothetical protein